MMRMKKRILLIALACMVMWPAVAQVLPKVGESSADDFIVRIAQTGMVTEGASLSYDKQTLYLSARKAPREVYDLYVAKKCDGKWQSPVLIDKLSSNVDDIDPTISSNEMVIYFVRREKQNAGTRHEVEVSEMYAAERQPDGTWQTPQHMVISNGKDSKLSILPDNKVLCFTSIRSTERNAQPMRYYVKKLDKYNWTLPIEVAPGVVEASLGGPLMRLEGQVNMVGAKVPVHLDVYDVLTQRKVNTVQADHEGRYAIALPAGARYKIDVWAEGYSHVYNWLDCAELAADRIVVWNPELSQEVFITLCTYDLETRMKLKPLLIVTESGRKQSSAARQAPNGDYALHLGMDKDYHLSLACEGHIDTSFHIDTRRDVRFVDTELDMYMRSGKIYAKVQVVDAETGEPIHTQMTLRDMSQDEEEKVSVEGTHAATWRCATTYKLNFSTAGYLYKDTTVTTPAREQHLDIVVAQMPLQKAVTVQLKNIQFEYGSYLLKEESIDELQTVAQLMRENPSLRVELSAHTDDTGSEGFNLRLSQARAESVANYLVEEEHIEADRLVVKGYGKSKPLVPNDSDENRAINRRVEFIVLDL